MEHQEVVENVKNWLKREHPFPRRVIEGIHADLLVATIHRGEKSFVTYHLQVECKGTDDSIDVAVGQCLRYYALPPFKSLFTYLAIPEDFKLYKELQSIFGIVTLPIGLIIVHRNGELEVIKKAEGKERTLKI